MNVQYLSNEKGEKIAAVVPIKDWEKMQEQLKLTDLDFYEHYRIMLRMELTRHKNNPLTEIPKLMMK